MRRLVSTILITVFLLAMYSSGSAEPNNIQILFTARDDAQRNRSTYIYGAAADGTSIVNLTSNGRHWDDSPIWSPDGTKFAFRSSRGKARKDIFVMNADGTNIVNITDGKFGWVTDSGYTRFTWSPDGKEIAFIAPGGRVI